ncbi:MAG: histidine kinase N-terminal 7TM domain-containing protein, partial [Eubacteriales bacterium]|nr:histidine kinase N-terminal 7TM domain-containing protein [Eubacteriales bacterium]
KDSVEARYLWYLYYIPMMLYPAFSIFAAAHIGKRDDWILPRKYLLLLLIPFSFFGVIITNDLHQLVFVFPDNGRIWSDSSYSYGVLYVLPYLWFFACTVSILIILYRRCRIPRKREWSSRLIAIPPILGFAYNFAYITGHAFFQDFILVMSFMTCITFEMAIRTGYIRSNSNYIEVFQKTKVSAQILDRDLIPRYVSENSTSYDPELLRKVVDTGSVQEHYLRLSACPIQGGYALWQEDVREIIHLQEELEDANEYLKGRSVALSKSYSVGMKRRRLEEQNRLYNEMQNQTEEKLTKLSALIEIFEHTSRDSENQVLCQIGVISAFLKRRNNLIFLAEGSRLFPAAELRNCIKETAKVLEMFQVTCKLHLDTNAKMSFAQVVALYDALEELIEQTVDQNPSYYISVTGKEDRQILRVRIAGINEVPVVSIQNIKIFQEDEEEYLFIIEEKT